MNTSYRQLIATYKTQQYYVGLYDNGAQPEYKNALDHWTNVLNHQARQQRVNVKFLPTEIELLEEAEREAVKMEAVKLEAEPTPEPTPEPEAELVIDKKTKELNMEKSYTDLIGAVNLQRTYAERYRVAKTDADRERLKAGYLILKAEVEVLSTRVKELVDCMVAIATDDSIVE